MQIFKYLKEKHVFIAGGIFLAIAALYSKGFFHWDEYHQILEFAALKLGLTTEDQLAWEYDARIRPTIQPIIAMFMYRFVAVILTEDSFATWAALRLLTAGLSFSSMYLIYQVYKKDFDNEIDQKFFLILSFLLWFGVYNGVRFSSESWSGSIFIIGFSLYFLKNLKSWWTYLLLGLIFGIAFVLRFQVAFLIIGFLAWLVFVKKEQWHRLALIVTGGVALVLSGILLDSWFYGESTITSWNYFYLNIIEDKAAGFGVSPWWSYFSFGLRWMLPPFSIIIILALLFFFRYQLKSPITWSILPFLAIHFLIGHKELRFLFPIIGFIPLLLSVFISGIRISPRLKRGRKVIDLIIITFLIYNFVMLITVSFRPTNLAAALQQEVYSRFREVEVLHFAKKDPYHGSKPPTMRFVKRRILETKKLDSKMSQIFDGLGRSLYAHRYSETPTQLPPSAELVYSTYPEWINSFELYRWSERANGWNLYLVTTE